MNTIYSMSHNAQAYFSENFLSACMAHEKKVALVAAAIFAAAFLYCFVRLTNAWLESKMSVEADGEKEFKSEDKVTSKASEEQTKSPDDVKSVRNANPCSEVKISIYNDGKIYEINMHPINSVLGLKAKIYQKYGIQMHKQTLLFEGNTLASNTTLESYHLPKDAVIELVLMS